MIQSHHQDQVQTFGIQGHMVRSEKMICIDYWWLSKEIFIKGQRKKKKKKILRKDPKDPEMLVF